MSDDERSQRRFLTDDRVNFTGQPHRVYEVTWDGNDGYVDLVLLSIDGADPDFVETLVDVPVDLLSRAAVQVRSGQLWQREGSKTVLFVVSLRAPYARVVEQDGGGSYREVSLEWIRDNHKLVRDV